ncbi:YmfQ family protein [Edwardsiella piscicida]|uniref:YmfQ family protein n=1 Tax=Edwardsiella piscicida TaxID=1263550 RepID=UPI00370D2560
MSLFSKDDYAGALGALLPSGKAWPRVSKTVHAAVLRALGRAFQRSDYDAVNLVSGAFPPTATSMLPEWESTLGLPDDCVIGEVDSVSDRQRMVVAKLISTGGLNRDYYIHIAATLGYIITITQFRPSMCGMSACGDALNGDEWPFVWRINAPETTIKYALSGASYCGDPLASWGNKQLECALTKIAPSHLHLIFSYA